MCGPTRDVNSSRSIDSQSIAVCQQIIGFFFNAQIIIMQFNFEFDAQINLCAGNLICVYIHTPLFWKESRILK